MEAQDYKKLIEALTCGNDGKLPCHNNECSYWVDQWHGIGLCNVIKKDADAADAIEALRKRLVSALTALHLANEKMGYYGIQPYTEADGDDMISDWVKTLVHEELEQQLPKQGKWLIHSTGGSMATKKCPFCGSESWQSKEYAKVPKYCENCGAHLPTFNIVDWVDYLYAKMEGQE